MSEGAICERLEISVAERVGRYGRIAFINHEWDNPAELRRIGTIPAAEIATLTGGRFAMDVPVDINRRLYDYDHLIIVGPVFPHEVVGFSGATSTCSPALRAPKS